MLGVQHIYSVWFGVLIVWGCIVCAADRGIDGAVVVLVQSQGVVLAQHVQTSLHVALFTVTAGGS